MARAGYSVANLTELANYPANYRREDQPIVVGSEDAWYIYKPASSATVDLPSIAGTYDNNGRWFRMQAAAPSGGPGGGSGGAEALLVTAPPTSTPSAIGAIAVQNTISSGTLNFIGYDSVAYSIPWTFERRSTWCATGTGATSWIRSGVAPSVLVYDNVVSYYSDPVDGNLNWPSVLTEYETRFRTNFDIHPEYEGELLIVRFRAASNLAYAWKRYLAMPITENAWNSYGGIPTISPDLIWAEESSGGGVNDPNWY
jgi:hypothetical protein